MLCVCSVDLLAVVTLLYVYHYNILNENIKDVMDTVIFSTGDSKTVQTISAYASTQSIGVWTFT